MRNKRKVAGYIFLASILLNVILIIVNISLAAAVSHKSRQPTSAAVETTAQSDPEPIIVEKLIEPPSPAYAVTSVERELLARIVCREAGGESLDCQKAVVTVVFNRLNNGTWGDTLKKVLYAESQFAVVPIIDKTTPDERNYAAVDYVLQHGGTIPPHILYFREGYHFKWDGYIGYTAIDNTYFGYFEKDLP